ADSIEAEIDAVADWLRARLDDGFTADEIGVIVRSERELQRAQQALSHASIPFVVLDEKMRSVSGKASVGTMHLAKGLEFRAVAVMACDDEVIPSQERIEAVTDDADLVEVYATER